MMDANPTVKESRITLTTQTRSVGKNAPSSFARVESEDFRRLRARGIDKSMEIDPAAFNAVGEIEIDTLLE